MIILDSAVQDTSPGSLAVGALVVAVVALSRVVEYFLSKYLKKVEPPALAVDLAAIHGKLDAIRHASESAWTDAKVVRDSFVRHHTKMGDRFDEQDKMLHEIKESVVRLDERSKR